MMRRMRLGLVTAKTRDRDDRGDRRQDEDPQLHAGEEQRAEHDEDEDHRGAEVAAGQDGRDHERSRPGTTRDEHVPPQPEQRLLAEQHVAHPQREAELEELRRLRLEAARS